TAFPLIRALAIAPDLPDAHDARRSRGISSTAASTNIGDLRALPLLENHESNFPLQGCPFIPGGYGSLQLGGDLAVLFRIKLTIEDERDRQTIPSAEQTTDPLVGREATL